MQTFNLRHQLHIHRHQIGIFFLVVLCFSGQQLFGQSKKRYIQKNLSGYDEKALHYGFSLGFHTSYNSLLISDEMADIPSIIAINPKPSAGFNVGFLAQFRLSDYYDFRFHPTISFYENRLDYSVVGPGSEVFVQEEIIEGTRVELPFLIKFKSSRVNNHRMYFIGGIKPILEGGRRKEDQAVDTRIEVMRSDLAIDIGFGTEQYFSFFKFSPEIRYSFGLGNILANREADITRAIDRLSYNSVSILLVFQ
jgi:hypothetical protein